MSQPSHWPLPPDGIRLVTPDFLHRSLRANPLTADCHPTALGYYPHASGHVMERRQHDDNLLIFCVDGAGELETDERDSAIEPGDILLLPAGTPHRYRADLQRPWSIYWCHFSGRQTQAYCDLITGARRRLSFPVVNRVKLIRDFQSLLSVRETGYRQAPFIHASDQLRQMLSFIALQTRGKPHLSEPRFDLQAVEDTMRANIDKQLSLQELADLCSLSKYHFATKYREATGYSPIKHFLHMKVELASQLLDTTSLRIGAVSEAVGYDDPLYFSRVFRKVTGLSPREYRAYHKK